MAFVVEEHPGGLWISCTESTARTYVFEGAVVVETDTVGGGRKVVIVGEEGRVSEHPMVEIEVVG